MSPGPSLFMIVNITRSGGIYRGIAASIGHGIGICFYASLAVSGLGFILVNIPEIYNFITYLGVLVLVLFGIQLFIDGFKNKSLKNDTIIKGKNISGFFQGFLVAVINPKVIIFFIALFSQFIIKDSSFVNKISIIIIAGSIDFLWYLMIAVIFSRTIIISLLLKYKFYFDISLGSILILFSIFIVISSINI